MKTKFNQFLNESKEPIIEIEETTDERSPKKNKTYSVSYQLDTEDGFVDISGSLIIKNTGRNDEYFFEPDYFIDEYSEDYYDNNWEEIEEEIIRNTDKL